jgi:hypothetical protein
VESRVFGEGAVESETLQAGKEVMKTAAKAKIKAMDGTRRVWRCWTRRESIV